MSDKPAKKTTEGSHSAAEKILADLADDEAQPALPLAGDVDAFDLVAKAAEQVNASRRARGRPAGSANRRNAEMFDYLEARGFKAPELRLMEIVSADPRALALAIAGVEPGRGSVDFAQVLEVVKLQLKAAGELMPYKFAKRQELKVEASRTERHIFIAGRLTEAMRQEASGGMRLDGGLSNEINGALVRQQDNGSHDGEICKPNQKDGL